MQSSAQQMSEYVSPVQGHLLWMAGSLISIPGVWLEIHGPNYIPFIGIKDGVTLAPGTSNNINYRISTITRLPEPYGKCKDVDGVYIEKYNKTIDHIVTGCSSLCLAKRIISKCVCIFAEYSIVWFNSNATLPYCGDIKMPIDILDLCKYC